MAAHSLSRPSALASKCRALHALETDSARRNFVGASNLRVPRGLGAAVATRSAAGNPISTSFKRVEFGRRKMLRRRGGDASCAAGGPSTLEKESPRGLPEGYMQEMQEFLRKDLVHLFDEQGIDKSMYDEKVEFRDPITNYDSLTGYLFNIGMLRALFHPIFELHSVKQTAPYEITTRWTMTMNFWIVLWKPQLNFTGVSIMRVNPATGKFCAHIDRWDSIQNNEYFSIEGAKDVIRQMQYFKQPDLETPKYKVLKRTAVYQVREYEPFIVVETDCDSMAGSKGFNTVAGYIFGKNEKGEKMKMTTPVYTEMNSEPSASGAKIQIVLPSSCKLSELPAPEVEDVKIQQVEKRFAAALRFNGKPTLEVVEEKKKILEQALRKDGLKLKGTFGLARYNDPGRTWPIFMKNEVLAWLEDFQLD